MSNQYFSFYYDPVRQGFDASTWRTLFGDPNVSGNRLNLPFSTIVHYGDILRGDATFSLYMPAPAIGQDRKIGFIQYSKGAYIYFKISNTSFSAEASNGSVSTSESIDWQSAWTNTNTEFRIRWEAGRVDFYIAGNLKTTINDASVPGDPLSLYLSNMSSSSSVILNYISIKGIQSYLFSAGDPEGAQNSTFGAMAYNVDSLGISETVTLATLGMSPSASRSPSSSVSPSASISSSRSPSASVSPSSSVSPSASRSPSSSVSPSASSSLSLSPSASVSPSGSTSPSASVSPSSSSSASRSPSSSVSPSASSSLSLSPSASRSPSSSFSPSSSASPSLPS